MPHMNTYGAQMDRKWTGSERKWARSGLEVSICPSVRTSVHPKHFPYLLDKPYARDLQAQGACALRFFKVASNCKGDGPKKFPGIVL